MLKKSLGLCCTLLLSSLFLAGCQSGKNAGKKGVPTNSDTDVSATTQGAGEQGDFGSWNNGEIDAGTTFSDQGKCTIMPSSAGTEQHFFFAFDNSKIEPRFMTALKAQATYLANHSHKKVVVQGNTDDRGSREYNVALGWRRARAVTQILEQYGVSKKQIDSTSFGAERPVAFGQTETAWRCNRRVDLIYQ